MFDFFSQSGLQVHNESLLHPSNCPTWPDMVRESRAEDPEHHLFRVFTLGQFSSFVAVFMASISRNLLRKPQITTGLLPARRSRVHGRYLPFKRHYLVHR